MLTEPGLDFAQRRYSPLPFESAEQLVRVFDEGSAAVRKALQNTGDEVWNDPWKLSAGPRTIFEGTRFLGVPADVHQPYRPSPGAARRLLAVQRRAGPVNLRAFSGRDAGILTCRRVRTVAARHSQHLRRPRRNLVTASAYVPGAVVMPS